MIYMAPLIVRGAGLRWRPLHESAEAPTEPGGETLLSEAKLRGYKKQIELIVQSVFLCVASLDFSALMMLLFGIAFCSLNCSERMVRRCVYGGHLQRSFACVYYIMPRSCRDNYCITGADGFLIIQGIFAFSCHYPCTAVLNFN